MVGLAMSLVWRSRLGRGALPAIAGFAVLAAAEALNRIWSLNPVSAGPGLLDVLAAAHPADLTVLVVTYVAYPAGLGLLLNAVLRVHRTEPDPAQH